MRWDEEAWQVKPLEGMKTPRGADHPLIATGVTHV